MNQRYTPSNPPSFARISPGGIPPVPLSRRKRLVGLDLGTSKVVVVMAEADDYGQLNVTGVGETPAEGLRKGVVVNIDKTVQAIQQAMVGAERTDYSQQRHPRHAHHSVAGDKWN